MLSVKLKEFKKNKKNLNKLAYIASKLVEKSMSSSELSI